MNTPPRTPEQYRIPMQTTPPPVPRLRRTPTDRTVIVDEEMDVEPLNFGQAIGDQDDAMDFDLPLPFPLVRQNAVYEIPAIEEELPQGRAYEIHRYAQKINPEVVISTYEKIMNKSRRVYSWSPDSVGIVNSSIIQMIWDKFYNGILVNSRFSREAKPEKLRDFQMVFQRIRNYDFTRDMEKTQMILFSVNYMLDFNKSDILRQLYIDSFLTDCIEAYPSETRYSGMTCVAGAVERLYTSVPVAIEQRLREPNVGRYVLSAKQKLQYEELFKAFRQYEMIMDELNRATMEWFMNIEDETHIPADVNERKRLLMTYIIQHMNRQGFPSFSVESPELEEYMKKNRGWLEVAISRNPPVMGGKLLRKNARVTKNRRTKNRKQKNRKTQNRRTQK